MILILSTNKLVELKKVIDIGRPGSLLLLRFCVYLCHIGQHTADRRYSIRRRTHQT